LIDPVESNTEGGTYELWQLGLGPNSRDWKTPLLELANSLQGDEIKLCGAFSSVFGPMDSAVLIWRHQELDKAPLLQENLFKSEKGKQFLSNVTSKQSKILAPTNFSPWK